MKQVWYAAIRAGGGVYGSCPDNKEREGIGASTKVDFKLKKSLRLSTSLSEDGKSTLICMVNLAAHTKTRLLDVLGCTWKVLRVSEGNFPKDRDV